MGESNVSAAEIIAGIKEKFNIKLIITKQIRDSAAIFTVKMDVEGHVDLLTRAEGFSLPDGISELDLIEDQVDTLIPDVEYGVVMYEPHTPQTKTAGEQIPQRIGKFSDCFVLYLEEDNMPEPLVAFSVTGYTVQDIQYSQLLQDEDKDLIRQFIRIHGINLAAKHIYEFEASSSKRYTLHAISDQVLSGEFKKFMFNKKNQGRQQVSQEVTQNESKVNDHIVLSENCPEGATEIAYIPSDKGSFTVNMSFYDLQDIKDELDVPMEALVARILTLWRESELRTFSSFIHIVYTKTPQHAGQPRVSDEINHSAVDQINNMISLFKPQ